MNGTAEVEIFLPTILLVVALTRSEDGVLQISYAKEQCAFKYHDVGVSVVGKSPNILSLTSLLDRTNCSIILEPRSL